MPAKPRADTHLQGGPSWTGDLGGHWAVGAYSCSYSGRTKTFTLITLVWGMILTVVKCCSILHLTPLCAFLWCLPEYHVCLKAACAGPTWCRWSSITSQLYGWAFILWILDLVSKAITGLPFSKAFLFIPVALEREEGSHIDRSLNVLFSVVLMCILFTNAGHFFFFLSCSWSCQSQNCYDAAVSTFCVWSVSWLLQNKLTGFELWLTIIHCHSCCRYNHLRTVVHRP